MPRQGDQQDTNDEQYYKGDEKNYAASSVIACDAVNAAYSRHESQYDPDYPCDFSAHIDSLLSIDTIGVQVPGNKTRITVYTSLSFAREWGPLTRIV